MPEDFWAAAIFEVVVADDDGDVFGLVQVQSGFLFAWMLVSGDLVFA